MYDKLTDNELCVLYKNGDDRAFTELYNRWQATVEGRVFKLVKYDKQEIPDLLQEIWSTVARYLKSSFKGESTFGTYLYTIVRTRYLNHFRYSKLNYMDENEYKKFDSIIYNSHKNDDDSLSLVFLDKGAFSTSLTSLVEQHDYQMVWDCTDKYYEIMEDVLSRYDDEAITCYLYKDNSVKGMKQAERETSLSYTETKAVAKEIDDEINTRFETYVRKYY